MDLTHGSLEFQGADLTPARPRACPRSPLTSAHGCDHRRKPVNPDEHQRHHSTVHAPDARATPSVCVGRAVRSELVKFRTLRSNVWLFAVAIGFLLVLGPVQALGSVLAESEATITDSAGAVSTALTGATTSTLLLGVLGVLLVAGEYAPRAIRTTFMAVPRRGVVVVAKAVALSLLSRRRNGRRRRRSHGVDSPSWRRGDLDVGWASPHVLRVSPRWSGTSSAGESWDWPRAG